jgi:hypothetical protein
VSWERGTPLQYYEPQPQHFLNVMILTLQILLLSLIRGFDLEEDWDYITLNTLSTATHGKLWNFEKMKTGLITQGSLMIK